MAISQIVTNSIATGAVTAAIKELSAKNDALEARIAALEGAANVPA
jgi:cell division protein FtsB